MSNHRMDKFNTSSPFSPVFFFFFFLVFVYLRNSGPEAGFLFPVSVVDEGGT